MRAHRSTAVFVGMVAALGVAGSARAAYPVPKVAAAEAADHGVVAWSQGGYVRVATQQASGKFGGGRAVGRILGAGSQQIAANATGNVVLVWVSGRTLRSEVRTAAGTWHFEQIPSAPATASSDLHVTIDVYGDATALWADGDTTTGARALYASTRPVNGSWSAPAPIATGVTGDALALDNAGDVLVAYHAGAVFARTLTAAGAWTDPVSISASDTAQPDPLLAAGGGARTFVVSWQVWTTTGPHARAARLAINGGWAGPADVAPTASPALALGAPAAVAYPVTDDGLGALAVDAAGNAIFAWPFSNLEYGYGLAVSDWLSSAAGSATQQIIEEPGLGERYFAARTPQLAIAGDGSVTLGYVYWNLRQLTLRAATSVSTSSGWLGGGADITSLATCQSTDNDPCSQTLVPATASGASATVVASPTPAGVVVVARASASAPWSTPATLEPLGASGISLARTKVSAGRVRLRATCALPPCAATVAVRSTGAKPRIVGSVKLSIPGLGGATQSLTLPNWARTLAGRKQGLSVTLDLGLRSADGSGERLSANVKLRS